MYAISHTDLADLLGTDPETLTRVLSTAWRNGASVPVPHDAAAEYSESDADQVCDLWHRSGAADCIEEHGTLIPNRSYYQRMPYQEYLQTDRWQVLRQAAIARDGGRCRLCNSDRDLQVHHRTYASLGSPSEAQDVVCTCAACHSRLHRDF